MQKQYRAKEFKIKVTSGIHRMQYKGQLNEN